MLGLIFDVTNIKISELTFFDDYTIDVTVQKYTQVCLLFQMSCQTKKGLKRNIDIGLKYKMTSDVFLCDMLRLSEFRVN